MGTVANYDAIAPYYDLMVKLVFGKQLQVAESFFLPRMKEIEKVLIFGGGTGKILDPLMYQYPHAEVYYVEASLAMMSRAKGKVRSNQNIHFIHGTEAALHNLESSVNTIITSYILDVFSPVQIQKVLKLLTETLTEGGIWLNTDFVVSNSSPLWHKLLIKTMYRFFKFTTAQENQQLPEWDHHFGKLPLNQMDQQYFVNRMVRSTLYQKRQAADPSH